jgi:hypothetical protein
MVEGNSILEDEDVLSYDTDIAPLRGQFVQIAANTGLPVSMQAQLVRGSLSQLLGDKEQELAAKERALRFTDAKLRLEQTRRDLAVRRQGMASLSALQNDLQQAVLGTAPDTRGQALSLVGMNYADVLASNPIAKSMFDSALSGSRVSGASGTPQAMTKSLMDDLDKVDLAKDYAQRPLNEFEEAGHEGLVDTVIDIFGSAEDKQKAAGASAKDKLMLAQKLRTNYYKSAITGGTAATPSTGPAAVSPRSLFRKPE